MKYWDTGNRAMAATFGSSSTASQSKPWLVGKGGDRRRHRAVEQPVDRGAPPPRARHRREHHAGR